MKAKSRFVLFVFALVSLSSPLAFAQTVTVEITGTVTSVDSALTSEFAVGESVVFTAEVDATAGWDLFGANTSIDATRFGVSPSTLATFAIGGDYTGSNTVGQLDFYDNYGSGFPNTAEGFRWGSNNFTAPAVNGIPHVETYIDVELADSTYPASAISDPEDVLSLGDLSDPILLGTKQNSVISFFDTTYHYLKFNVDAITITTPLQEVTVEITGTVTSVDSALTSEFAVGEAVVFTAEVDATAGFDLNGTSTSVDGTRFVLSPSTLATFTVGGDYTGSNTRGQMDFYDNFSSGFNSTSEGFQWSSNNFTAPAVNGIPHVENYIDVEFADNTYPASAISDPIDALSLEDLPDPILLGTHQGSVISFFDTAYRYVFFDVTAVTITPVSSVIDTDGDGVADDEDNCPGVLNPGQTDTDSDGVGDACDDDDDNDTVDDDLDNCQFTPNNDQANSDGVGAGDACNADIDGDEVDDNFDNCPANPNPFQTDTDGDGAGDACDDDDDNDGVCDIDQAGTGCSAGPDNCPALPNPGQSDSPDSDGIGDDCDADDDNDGTNDEPDNCPVIANADQNDSDGDYLGDACDADDDNDGVLDLGDNCQFISNSAQNDFDGNGVGDACEDDLDGDFIGDASDNCPLDANSDQNDFDGDGSGDTCDNDIDGDGVVNEQDVCASTPGGESVLPGNGCSIAQASPCDGPRGTNQSWRNHGKYISSVAHAAKDFLDQGLITQSEKDAIQSEAAESACGNKK
jgi:hypothetical protein